MKMLRALIRASLTCRSNIGTPSALKAFSFLQARAYAQLGVKPKLKMKLRHEINYILLTVFLLCAVSNGYPETKNAESSQSEVVWHWTDEDHAEKHIIFETTVDGTVVSTATFPVRRDARSEIIPGKKQRITEYNFTLHKKRGRNFRGITHGKVEGNIWEAGGEKNGIIFGITWVTQEKIILHELYPVLEDKAENIEIYKGVSFKTYWTSK